MVRYLCIELWEIPPQECGTGNLVSQMNYPDPFTRTGFLFPWWASSAYSTGCQQPRNLFNIPINVSQGKVVMRPQTLFVVNLKIGVTECELLEFSSKCGKVSERQIIPSGKAAILEFESYEAQSYKRIPWQKVPASVPGCEMGQKGSPFDATGIT